MKRKLKSFFKGLLQKKGIFIQRFPTAEAFYNYIKNETPDAQLFELKRICKSLRETNNQTFYNGLLKQFVPQWDKKIEYSKFINKGFGKHNLNTYREVHCEEGILFEKIFYSDSEPLKKMLLLEKEIKGLLEEKIKIPQCRQFFEHDVLTIVYYEFLSKPLVPRENIQKEAAEMSGILYRVPVDNLKNTLPQHLIDFRKYSHYHLRDKHKAAKRVFEKEDILYKNIEEDIEKGRYVLTHGDIKYSHVYENHTLIDWDEFGIYPAGLEQAYIFFGNILDNNIINIEPLKWLRKYYQSMVPKEEWDLFELSFLYFLFIFGINDIQKAENNKLKSNLIEEIKKGQ